MLLCETWPRVAKSQNAELFMPTLSVAELGGSLGTPKWAVAQQVTWGVRGSEPASLQGPLPVPDFRVSHLRFFPARGSRCRNISPGCVHFSLSTNKSSVQNVWSALTVCYYWLFQVKVAILKYIESLARQMDPTDFVNSSETRLAVSRIITWTTEPKSSDVRKVCPRAPDTA